MNNKRQTIWLVSMLSLMVILSAYYLFTGDNGSSKKPVADSQQVDSKNKNDAQEANADTKTENGVDVTEIVTDGKTNGAADNTSTASNTDTGAKDADSKSDGKETASKDNGTNDKETAAEQKDLADTADKSGTAGKADGKETASKTDGSKDTAKTEQTDSQKDKETAQGSKSDSDILKEVAAQTTSGNSFIEKYQWERSQSNQKKYNDLTTKINSGSSEEAAKASEEWSALEDKEEKLTWIEEELEQKYSFANAFIKEDDDKYTVLVLSDKKSAKDAASIVELVMKELNVKQDKVSVKYVAQ